MDLSSVLLVLFVVGWLVFELVFWQTHKRPLTKDEILKLAEKRQKKYIKQIFTFSEKTNYTINLDFKSSMNPKGEFRRIQEEDIATFPGLIAALLKHKKHEWIVFGFEKDQKIDMLWMNKGHNNSSVKLKLHNNELIEFCKNNGYTSMLSFHNHPNSDPSHYDCLMPSEQDKYSANSLGELANKKGINLIEFVCERGNWMCYYSSFSSLYYPLDSSPEVIKESNGISEHKNYRLHNELYLGRKI